MFSQLKCDMQCLENCGKQSSVNWNSFQFLSTAFGVNIQSSQKRRISTNLTSHPCSLDWWILLRHNSLIRNFQSNLHVGVLLALIGQSGQRMCGEDTFSWLFEKKNKELETQALEDSPYLCVTISRGLTSSLEAQKFWMLPAEPVLRSWANWPPDVWLLINKG